MSRRPLIVVAAFLLTVLASEALVRTMSGALPDPAPWPSNETELKARQLEGEGYSIVFVGPSVTEAAVDPALLTRLLGRETYSAATPYMSQASLHYWVERFVLPSTSPDLLVVGVPMWSPTFSSPSGEDPLFSALQEVEKFRRPETLWQRLRSASALLGWREELKSAADLVVYERAPEDYGLWTSRGHQTLYYDGEISPFTPSWTNLSGRMDFSFLTLVSELAASRGIRMAFLLEPSTCDAGGACLAPLDAVRLRQAYVEVAAQLGHPLLDIEGPFPQLWYADPAHFNRQGTVAYTTKLAEALQELGL